MMKRLCVSCAALVFALLITPAARATTLTFEELNIGFGNGYQAVGEVGFISGLPTFPDEFVPISVPTLYFDGSPLQFLSAALGGQFIEPWVYTTGDFTLPNEVVSYPAGTLPNVFLDFALNGTTAVSGDVTCISGACAATPLPAALPLFSSAVFALAGLAMWKWRRSPVALDA